MSPLATIRRLPARAVSAVRRVRAADSVWAGIAELVTAHPKPILGLTLVALLPWLLGLALLDLSHDELSELPDSAGSVQGFRAVAEHIPAGELSPVVLVVETGGTPVWDPRAMHALGLASQNLRKLDGVASVRSVAMPTNGEVPQQATGASDQVSSLTDGLARAADGAGELAGGIERVRDGLAEIDRRLPELTDGLDRAVAGTGRLRDGLVEARTGVEQLRGGLDQLRAGLVEARDGSRTLKEQVAEPASDDLRSAIELLRSMTVGKVDPAYEPTYREVGEAYGRIVGEYPPGHPQAGQPVREGYSGLPASLEELATGLGEAIDGVDRIDDGLAQLATGLDEAVAGTARLEDGLRQGDAGVGELQAGIGELLTGVDDRLLPGARQLAEGLRQGLARVEATGLTQLDPTQQAGPFVITGGMVEALPDLREQLAFFVSEDATTTRLFVGTEQAPYDERSIAAVAEMQQVVERSFADTPLARAEVVPTGTTAFFAAVGEASNRDFRLIVAAVLLGVFLVLAWLLRSLVAPLYLIATVLLSFGVALGVTTLVFQGLLGQAGISWFVPPMLFVLLVALGVDYDIFLMSRVREEAGRRPTVAAIETGLRRTGGVITSAGLILAGTFAALMAAPLDSMAQIGFAVAFGILLDTFVVRTFLVPSIAVLLGRWNWWPSPRAHREPDAVTTPDREPAAVG